MVSTGHPRGPLKYRWKGSHWNSNIASLARSSGHPEPPTAACVIIVLVSVLFRNCIARHYPSSYINQLGSNLRMCDIIFLQIKYLFLFVFLSFREIWSSLSVGKKTTFFKIFSQSLSATSVHTFYHFCILCVWNFRYQGIPLL